MKKEKALYFHNGSIGDFLMTLYLMDLLHKQDPKRELSIYVPRQQKVCKELALGYPYVTLITKKSEVIKEVFGGYTAILPPTPGSIPLSIQILAKLTSLGGGKLVGFEGTTFSNFLDESITYDDARLYHENMSMLAKLFGEVKDKAPTFTLVEQKDSLPERYIVIHPRGSSEGRSLRQKDLDDILACFKEYEGHVFISGSADDVKKYMIKNNDHISVIAGSMGMQKLGYLLAHCEFYIGVDTGVSHLASLVGAKGIVLAHNASTHTWLPYYADGIEVLAERSKTTKGGFAMSSMEDVCTKIKEHIAYA